MLYLIDPQPYGSGFSVNVKRKISVVLAKFPEWKSIINRYQSWAIFVLGLVVGFWPQLSLCQQSGLQGTQQLQTIIQQDAEISRYPHFQQFLKGIVPDRRSALGKTDESLAKLLIDAKQIDDPDRLYVRLSPAEVAAFFAACVQDKLTTLRAIGLVARVVSWTNVVLVFDGRDIETALKAHRLRVGLSLPMEHAALFAYIPQLHAQPPFLCKFFVVYDAAFTHSYESQDLDASVVIGPYEGSKLSARKVFDDGQPSASLYTVQSDILYNGSTVGLYSVRGITLAGWKAMAFGPVDEMFVEDGRLTIKGTHWFRKNVDGFERSEEWSRFGVHPDPP